MLSPHSSCLLGDSEFDAFSDSEFDDLPLGATARPSDGEEEGSEDDDSR
jgi:hypothetical protein